MNRPDRRLYRLIVGTILALVGLTSCGDDDGESNRIQIPQVIGTHWNYAISLATLDGPETLGADVSVIPWNGSESLVPGTTAARCATPILAWEFTYEDRKDTSLVFICDDTMKVFPKDLGFRSWQGSMYVFPLSVGANWRSQFYWEDTVRVVALENVTVPAGEFLAYRLESFGGAFNSYLSRTTWLVPDVGIVKMERSVYDLGPAYDDRWELTGYQFPEKPGGVTRPFR